VTNGLNGSEAASNRTARLSNSEGVITSVAWSARLLGRGDGSWGELTCAKHGIPQYLLSEVALTNAGVRRPTCALVCATLPAI